MPTIFKDLLSSEELHYLNNLPEVLAAKASLDSQRVVYFSVDVTDSIRSALEARFGLHISTGSSIPMRWIKGDTAPHIDRGASNFDNTYLVYLNNCPGEFILDSQAYPIEANTGFVFNEGIFHETQGTEGVARLLLGPMNEMAQPVGAPSTVVTYYSSLADLIAGTTSLEVSVSYTVTDPADLSSWRIGPGSTGTSTVNAVYLVGDVLNNNGVYYLYPAETSMFYFESEAAAIENTSSIGESNNYTVGAGGPYGGYEVWSLASTSTGTSSQLLIYYNGDFLNQEADGLYYLYPTYIAYYPSEGDAINNTNIIGMQSTDYIIASEYTTSWRISASSTGTSSQSIVYVTGDTLISDGFYALYPAAPCFLEGSKILCQVEGVETYVPVEELKKGTLVKTSLNGYKPVFLVGKGSLTNPGNDERTENRLYKCSPSSYPGLKDDLYITGCHSILEFPITDKQKEDTIKHLGKLFVTDKKYRLMACIDERAEPWNSEGVYTIWHFALEDPDDGINYGVYANGLLVETCSIRSLKNKSNMKLI